MPAIPSATLDRSGQSCAALGWLSSQETTKKGRRWDETKIKALTGGDRLTARFSTAGLFRLRARPSSCLSPATINTAPRYRGRSNRGALPAPLCPLPFRYRAGERDPELAAKLWDERAADSPMVRVTIDRNCASMRRRWRTLRHRPAYATRPTNISGARTQSASGWKTAPPTPELTRRLHAVWPILFSLPWKTWCEDRKHQAREGRWRLSGMLEDRGYAKRREGGTGQRGFAGIFVKKY